MYKALSSLMALMCVGLWLTGPLFGQATSSMAEGPLEAVLGEDGVQRLTIVLDSYAYRPSHVVVQAGKPVELTLVSVTIVTPHNFVVNEPGVGLVVEQDVGPGQSVVLRLTPRRAGTATFFCDKKLLFFQSHREKGMEGRLEIRE